MTIELYCFGESGNAYKPALAMDLAGLAWTPRHLDFFKGVARGEEFRRDVNEMGEAPVLVDEARGLRLTQSGVILDWIAEETGRFGGTTDDERREIMRWILWDNHRLSGVVGPCRFVMNFLPEAKRPANVADWLQARAKGSYEVLDAHLAKREWIVGEGPTIADLSCCGYLYYPEPFGFDRKDWPGIDAWLDRIAALPGWKHPYDMMRRAFPPSA